MGGTMNLNDLLDAAAEAWGEMRDMVWFEVSMKRVAIRVKGVSEPVFADVAPDHPAVGLVAEAVLRRAIAERLLQRAEQDTKEAAVSRNVAERREQWARQRTAMARTVDPEHVASVLAAARPQPSPEAPYQPKVGES